MTAAPSAAESAPATARPYLVPTVAARSARRQAPSAHLRRLRWAVRATLTLGVAASVAANILHANPNPISQMIAGWPPVALLLTVELISRVPTHRRSLAVIRLVATAAIAGIAAWVSYWHMVGVAARYGETEAAASYLLPLSVDGLVIVASVSLVEITGRIRADVDRHAADSALAAQPRMESHEPALTVSEQLAVQSAAHADMLRPPMPSPPAEPPADLGAPARSPSGAAGASVSAAHGEPIVLRADEEGHLPAPEADAGNDDDPVPSDTAAAVAYWYRRDSKLHPAEIAARIGRSERTVRRYLQPARTSGGRGTK